MRVGLAVWFNPGWAHLTTKSAIVLKYLSRLLINPLINFPTISGHNRRYSPMSTIPSDPSVHCFQLEVAPPAEAGPTAPVAPPTALCLDFGLPRKNQKQGSFDYDRENREKGGFVHEWTSLAEFEAWRQQEEITNSIELTVSKSCFGKEFKQKRVYKCSREPSGGEKPYKKKHPEWKRKRDSKKTGCRC